MKNNIPFDTLYSNSSQILFRTACTKNSPRMTQDTMNKIHFPMVTMNVHACLYWCVDIHKQIT